MMTPWRGSLCPVDGNSLFGLLEDDWSWEIVVEAQPQGDNRLFVACRMARAGREAPAERAGTRRQHEALASGARFTGQMTKEAAGISRLFRWRGSVLGPWQMRLTTDRWAGRGSVALYGEPV